MRCHPDTRLGATTARGILYRRLPIQHVGSCMSQWLCSGPMTFRPSLPCAGERVTVTDGLKPARPHDQSEFEAHHRAIVHVRVSILLILSVSVTYVRGLSSLTSSIWWAYILTTPDSYGCTASTYSGIGVTIGGGALVIRGLESHLHPNEN